MTRRSALLLLLVLSALMLICSWVGSTPGAEAKLHDQGSWHGVWHAFRNCSGLPALESIFDLPMRREDRQLQALVTQTAAIHASKALQQRAFKAATVGGPHIWPPLDEPSPCCSNGVGPRPEGEPNWATHVWRARRSGQFAPWTILQRKLHEPSQEFHGSERRIQSLPNGCFVINMQPSGNTHTEIVLKPRQMVCPESMAGQPWVLDCATEMILDDELHDALVVNWLAQPKWAPPEPLQLANNCSVTDDAVDGFYNDMLHLVLVDPEVYFSGTYVYPAPGGSKRHAGSSRRKLDFLENFKTLPRLPQPEDPMRIVVNDQLYLVVTASLLHAPFLLHQVREVA